MRRRTASLVPIGSALLWIAVGSCGGGDVTPPIDTSGPVVSSIRIVACFCGYPAPPTSERTIGVLGTKVLINAEALAEDGAVLYSTADNPSRFSWSSSDSAVATVDMSSFPRVPRITGVGEGDATITATSQGVTGEMTVTVRDRARVAWSVPLSGDNANVDLTIGADGTIFVVTNDSEQSHWYAVSPRGAVLWTLDLPHGFSTPAIGTDGTLYRGLTDGGLIAVSPNGTIRWMLEELDGIRTSPAIGPDGTVYVAGHKHVYAASPDGDLRWTFEADTTVFAHSSPAVASDGTIYVGGTDGVLYAINPNGSLRWKFEVGESNYIYSGPSIDRDGRVYFGALRGLYAVGPDGSGGARLLDRTVSSTPSIGPDGAIYVGAGWGESGLGVYAFGPNGSVRWSSRPSTNRTPILGAGGTVYVTATGPSGEQVIAALDSQGRLLWDYAPGGPYHPRPDGLPGQRFNAAPAIGIDGMILAVSGDPIVLYAIFEKNSTNGGYAGAHWPTARGNRANNGRAGG
jgi:outer membrane protein assembly factor BamB